VAGIGGDRRKLRDFRGVGIGPSQEGGTSGRSEIGELEAVRFVRKVRCQVWRSKSTVGGSGQLSLAGSGWLVPAFTRPFEMGGLDNENEGLF
jgi:hypothetical protein